MSDRILVATIQSKRYRTNANLFLFLVAFLVFVSSFQDFTEDVETAAKKVMREVEEEGLLDNEALWKFFEHQVKTASDGKCDGKYARSNGLYHVTQ